MWGLRQWEGSHCLDNSCMALAPGSPTEWNTTTMSGHYQEVAGPWSALELLLVPWSGHSCPHSHLLRPVCNQLQLWPGLSLLSVSEGCSPLSLRLKQSSSLSFLRSWDSRYMPLLGSTPVSADGSDDHGAMARHGLCDSWTDYLL